MPEWKREIQDRSQKFESIDTDPNEIVIDDWIRAQARKIGQGWLLAHADDGIIWGKIDSGNLVLIGTDEAVQLEIDDVPLRAETLQTARLFSRQQEIMVWRADRGAAWQARHIIDDTGDSWVRSFDEAHILWGDTAYAAGNGFTLMEEGAQGMRHAVPLDHVPIPNQPEDGAVKNPLRLVVRHYLDTDANTGFVRVGLSRLVELKVEE
jgi:CRISPR-associated protein (TIGR03984 family)